jgi:hypothetical protein
MPPSLDGRPRRIALVGVREQDGVRADHAPDRRGGAPIRSRIDAHLHLERPEAGGQDALRLATVCSIGVATRLEKGPARVGRHARADRATQEAGDRLAQRAPA